MNSIPSIAVPEILIWSYVISKNDLGNYYHAETGLVYDRDIKKFIGKQCQDGRVEQLSESDIEVCKHYNFPYLLPESFAKTETKVVVSELDDVTLEGGEEDIEEEDIEEDIDDGLDGLDVADE